MKTWCKHIVWRIDPKFGRWDKQRRWYMRGQVWNRVPLSWRVCPVCSTLRPELIHHPVPPPLTPTPPPKPRTIADDIEEYKNMSPGTRRLISQLTNALIDTGVSVTIHC